MLNKILYLSTIVLLLSSCKQEKYATLTPEYLFDAGNQQIITSLIDDKNKVIMMLYGNSIAYKAAQNEVKRPINGAIYTLVSWKQKEMPGWYGAKMNGAIYSVETLNISNTDGKGFKMDYQIKPGIVYEADFRQKDEAARIRHILAQHPVVLP